MCEIKFILNYLNGCIFKIVGLETNVEFIKDICTHPKFRNGDVHTGFIEENYDALFPKIEVPKRVLAEGALGLILNAEMDSLKTAIKSNDVYNPFALETGLRVNHVLNRRIDFEIGEENFFVDVQYVEPELYSMRINDLGPWRTVTGSLRREGNTLELKADVDGVVQKSRIVKIGNELHLFTHVSF